MHTLTARLRRRLSPTSRLGQRIGRSRNTEVTSAGDVQQSCPVELTAQGSRMTTLPIPDGWTRDEVYDLLASVSIESSPPGELEVYIEEDFERFLISWGLIQGCCGSALEIGANPYFISVLLREFTDLDPVYTNSFGDDAPAEDSQLLSYEYAPKGISSAVQLPYLSLNVETTGFPFDDGQFTTVLFCEVIEHLLIDPVAALREINRVLVDGGVLIVTTPNVARLENVARLAGGVNMYDPYSGYGPYGRHNREFTRHELVHLLGFCGFSVDHHFTADVHPHQAPAFTDVSRLAPLLEHRLPDLGQYLFCRATKVGAPTDGRPSDLYRSWSADSLVATS